jgi:hypothetical protein
MSTPSGHLRRFDLGLLAKILAMPPHFRPIAAVEAVSSPTATGRQNGIAFCKPWSRVVASTGVRLLNMTKLATLQASFLMAGALSLTPVASTSGQAKARFHHGPKTVYVHHNKKVSHLVKRKKVKSAKAKMPKARASVVAMIKSRAPSYGVPSWFALRIAHIESGYNPNARGLAGEYGIYQLKCSTARQIGFSGNCSNLLNASTNIHYGLKHLQQAVRLSGGNLKLAASKHNGGLGRRTLVSSYVRKVF